MNNQTTLNSKSLAQQLSQGTVLAPFVYDGLQAKLAQKIGYDAIYMTGFGASARLGLPDVGLTTFTEMLDNARTIASTVDIPLICDADTGYGNALNVHRTVREYENAGVAAMHLEDQQWPKRCGYMEGKSVIPAGEMQQKLRAAVDARRGDMIIIGRTDALQSDGWNEAEDRARSYLEEGVDMIFVDGVGEKDVAEYARRLGDLPVLFNNVPMIHMADIEPLPFNLVLHPGSMMALMSALTGSLKELKTKGTVTLSQHPNEIFMAALDALDAEHFSGLANKYS